MQPRIPTGSNTLRRSLWCVVTALAGGGAALLLLAQFAPVRLAAASDLSYPGCGPTIQACLDAATNGDNLTIAPGTYVTSVTLNKAVNLLGSGPQAVTLQALPGQRVLTVTGAVISNGVVISGLTFTGGSHGFIGGLGGGILITGTAQPVLHNIVVATNTASQHGGGVYANFGSNLVIEDSLILNNAAPSQGGGLWAGSSATLVNTRVENNRANGFQGFGGGLVVNVALTLVDSDLISNSASLIGGGAAVSGPAIVTGGRVHRNRCLDALCGGGGFYLTGGSAFSGTEFVSNTASYGGAINSTAALTLTATDFLTNTVDKNGGAVYMDTYQDTAEILTLIDSVFVGNQAFQVGGAVFALGPAVISGGRFEANRTTSGSFGGGALATAGPLDLNGTVFAANATNAHGGGLNVLEGDARLTNALFTANRAINGNALALTGLGSLTVLHATITSPTVGAGAAIHVVTGTLGVTNTILTHHATGINVAGGSAIEDYNLFFNLTTPTTGAASGGHSFADNPSFVNAGAGDYHLADGSSAIDAGLAAGVYSDVDGEPRPMGSRVDIGYDEAFQLTYWVYLPLTLR